MKKLTAFFIFCSGSDTDLLRKCPTETSKYVGIGATVFFTGLFAALAGGYSLYTVFDNFFAAALFGLLWGLMIFNLDRFIVSSMRKEGRTGRELLMAMPRIVLAVLISIVIAKPLELKIFEKEIQPELVMMEQEKFAAQEFLVKARYNSIQDSLKTEILALQKQVEAQTAKRDELARIAQEEADGTGGSRKRNLGPIYKVKKADADKAEAELTQLRQHANIRIELLQASIVANEKSIIEEIGSIDRGKRNGMAARIEALDRLTAESSAIFWAHWFIVLLFIALETAPVFVKLISTKGPYDNLLKTEEHHFFVYETENLAKRNADAKRANADLPTHESNFLKERLDASIK